SLSIRFLIDASACTTALTLKRRRLCAAFFQQLDIGLELISLALNLRVWRILQSFECQLATFQRLLVELSIVLNFIERSTPKNLLCGEQRSPQHYQKFGMIQRFRSTFQQFPGFSPITTSTQKPGQTDDEPITKFIFLGCLDLLGSE